MYLGLTCAGRALPCSGMDMKGGLTVASHLIRRRRREPQGERLVIRFGRRGRHRDKARTTSRTPNLIALVERGEAAASDLVAP